MRSASRSGSNFEVAMARREAALAYEQEMKAAASDRAGATA